MDFPCARIADRELINILELPVASTSELETILVSSSSSSSSTLPLSPRRLPRRLVRGSNVALRKLSPEITCPQSR